MKQFRCKGCGEIDSIVEISLVPRIYPYAPDGLDEDAPIGRGGDETFWEAETQIGYGCRNGECEFWHGSRGYPEGKYESKFFRFQRAWDPEEIAEVVDGE